MENELAVLLTAVLLSLTALSLLVLHDWRLSLIALSLQYTGMFLLLSTQWPLSMAATKIIAGWISAAVLGLAVTTNPELRQQLGSSSQPAVQVDDAKAKPGSARNLGIAFKLFAASLVLMATATQVFSAGMWRALFSPAYLWGGAVLIVVGALKLGFTNHPFHIFLALLSSLAGFEILYGALDKTVLSAGLFSAVNLAIAIAGAYLLTAASMETEG